MLRERRWSNSWRGINYIKRCCSPIAYLLRKYCALQLVSEQNVRAEKDPTLTAAALDLQPAYDRAR